MGDQIPDEDEYNLPSNQQQLLSQQQHEDGQQEWNNNNNEVEEEPPVKSKLPLPPPDEDMTYDHEFEDEWMNMSILTQFIGPAAATTELSAATNINEDLDRQVNKALEGLNKEFLSHTDSLDRGQQHLEALDRAVSRRWILARLRIMIQPQVLYKEDPDFQAEWREAKLRCELILIDVLRRHLSLRVIGKSWNSLRDLGKSAYKNIRKYAFNAEASNSVKNTLHEAESEHKQRNKQRANHHLEAGNQKKAALAKKRGPEKQQ